MIDTTKAAFQRLIVNCSKLLEHSTVINFMFPVIVCTGAVILKLSHPRIYGWLVKEDGLFEYTSAFFI